MSKTLKITLIAVAVLFGAAILVTGGIVLGRVFTFRNAAANYRFNDSRQPFGMGPGMMGRGFFGQGNESQQPYRQGPGMMGRGFFGQGNDEQKPYRKGRGMMGGGFFNNTYNGEPASIEEARTAFDAYITNLGIDDLELHEVMLFNQNAYAVVAEKSTGKGAMELLLDYGTGDVYPEIGPNHMWNLKYGMMGGRGNGANGFGMGCNINPDSTILSEMTVSDVDAKSAAQAFLDANEPGATAADEGMAFYGYYTFDYSLDGKIAGMLSVNGYNSQVWPHTWHGQFVDEWELE
jgi:hypothetical protein